MSPRSGRSGRGGLARGAVTSPRVSRTPAGPESWCRFQRPRARGTTGSGGGRHERGSRSPGTHPAATAPRSRSSPNHAAKARRPATKECRRLCRHSNPDCWHAWDASARGPVPAVQPRDLGFQLFEGDFASHIRVSGRAIMATILHPHPGARTAPAGVTIDTMNRLGLFLIVATILPAAALYAHPQPTVTGNPGPRCVVQHKRTQRVKHDGRPGLRVESAPSADAFIRSAPVSLRPANTTKCRAGCAPRGSRCATRTGRRSRRARCSRWPRCRSTSTPSRSAARATGRGCSCGSPPRGRRIRFCSRVGNGGAFTGKAWFEGVTLDETSAQRCVACARRR